MARATQITTSLLVSSLLLSSCASTTMLQSTPAGAKLYIDGEPVGTTPYRYSDTKIVGSTTSVRLEKEGYETLNTSFARDEQVDVGAIIGGVFVLVPFLWTMKYKPAHSYELRVPAPPAGAVPPAPSPSTVAPTKSAPKTAQSRAERLRENKKLLDEKVLTPAEYEKEKQRILAEPQ